MPEEKDYISKVYMTLRDNVDGFSKTEDEFRSAMKEKGYANKVYMTLKESIEGFDKSENEFASALGKPSAAPQPGGGGGLNLPTAPGMDGGRSPFGMGSVAQKIGQPMPQAPPVTTPPSEETPVAVQPNKKTELVTDMIFKKDVLEYNKLNVAENQGRYNDRGFNLALDIASQSGRRGPDAFSYAKRLQNAAVNQQAAARVEKEYNQYQQSILGEKGLQDVKNYNIAQTRNKESESQAKKAFNQENKVLFPTNEAYDKFQEKFTAPFAKEADLATKKLNPIIENLSEKITQQFKESGGKDFVLSSDAGKVPNPDAISNYVEDKAYILGFGEDKLFKSYLKTRLQGAIEYALIEPEVMKKFQSSPEYQKIQKEKADVASKLMAIPATAKKEAEFIGEDINTQYKMAAEPLSNAYVEKQNVLKINYEIATALIQQQANELNLLAQQGQIDPQAYSEQINNLNNQAAQLYQEYTAQFEGSNQMYLDELNQINTKYNAQYRRRIKELNAANEVAYNKLKREYDEMGLSAQDRLTLEEAYKRSYNEAAKEKFGKEQERTYQTALSKRVLDRFSSGIGSTMRGFGETFDIPSMKLMGEQLLAQSYLSPLDYKKYQEGLGSYILESSAQLGGSMVTSAALTATGASITGGTIMPLVLGGLAGWSSESIEIAGNIAADVFEQTGSLKKSEDAAAKSWETQTVLMPLYALEAAPFIKGFIKGKTILGRVSKGAALEFVGEYLQEYPQGIFEEAIKKEGSPYEALGTELSNITAGIRNLEMNPSIERGIQTAVDIGPVMILGAAGPARDIYAEKRKQSKVSKFVSKLTPADFANDAMSQFVYRTTAYKGKDFATAVVTSLYSGGQIDKAQFDQMINQVERANQMYVSGQQAGLTNQQFVILSALGSKSENARRLADAEPQDSPLKTAMEARAKSLESMVQQYSAGENVSIIVTTLPNGDQVINTFDEIKQKLSNPDFVDELFQGGITFDVLNNQELGKELADLVSTIKPATAAPAEEAEGQAFIHQQRAKRDAEIAEIEKIRPDLTDQDLLIMDLPDAVDRALDRMDANIPSDPVQVQEAIDALDKKFDELEAYKKDPKRTHTTEQIDEVIDLLSESKSELQAYQEKLSEYEPATKAAEPTAQAEQRPTTERKPETPVSETAPKAETAEGVAPTEAAPPAAAPTTEEVKAPEVLITAADFAAFEAKKKGGRAARAELRNRVGNDTYKRMEEFNKNFEKTVDDLEAQGKIKQRCK